MNKIEIAEEKLHIYSGILLNYQEFEKGNHETISYDFTCPEFHELKEKYQLTAIAEKGSDFQKAKRLLHYFAPRLHHNSWYDNHIECNALKLLEYSLNNKEHGINCLNKSKILEECCLALQIYARRVSILPYSPYDYDNHVVVEIFDRQLNKWIMLDPTTDGYFIDENKLPLSLLEIRDRFANDEFVTFVTSTNRLDHLDNLRKKHMDINQYICKNLFYFMVDQECKFGEPEHRLIFCPTSYSVKKNKIANLKYRIKYLPEENKKMENKFKQSLSEMINSQEPSKTNIENMAKAPI